MQRINNRKMEKLKWEMMQNIGMNSKLMKKK
jgi:hypothetical protein